MLAAYTYSSGLRAPALIAFVKDTLIYIVIAVAIIYIPIKLGGFDDIFAAAEAKHGARPTRPPASRRRVHPAATRATGPTRRWRSARRWRCSCTRTRSRRRCPSTAANVIRRNTTILPLYSLMLGLLALLGFMAIAAGIKRSG